MVGLVAATIEDAGAADCSPSSRKKEREREIEVSARAKVWNFEVKGVFFFFFWRNFWQIKMILPIYRNEVTKYGQSYFIWYENIEWMVVGYT